MIIGITGKKGHGKDAIGQILAERHAFWTTAFAAPLKEAVKVALRMTDEQIYGPIETKETVDPRYGVTPRHAMQTLGTEWGRQMIHEDVWALSAMARIREEPPGTNWAITDLRFLNERRLLRAAGGLVLRVIRPGARSGKFEEHESERAIDDLIPDIVIYNNGDLEDLARVVDEVLVYIKSTSSPKPFVKGLGVLFVARPD